MKYEITVRHFSQRTRKNLETIERLSKDNPDEYFEVTQLINSAIGLLMFPQQEFFDSLPNTEIDQLKNQGWPIPIVEHGSAQTPNLRELIKYMRNSFAHFNIDFQADGGKVSGIYLWNRKHSTVDWLCYISVSDLRVLFDRIAKLGEKASADNSYKEIRVAQIRSEIKRLL